MGYGGDEENASSQGREMPICGSRSGKNCTARLEERLWLKWSMSRHTVQRKKRKICRTLKILLQKATRRRMNWQKQEQSWMKALWRKEDQKLCSRSEKEVYAALQYAEWKNGRVVENSSRSQKKSGLSWTRKERRRNIERNGVLKPAGIDA